MVLALSHRSEFTTTVATVHDGGPLWERFPTIISASRRRGRPGIRALSRLTRLARDADIVHTHLWAGDLWGGWAGILANRPVIAHLHNVDRDQAPWRDHVQAAMWRHADACIVVSSAVSRHARHAGVEPEVIANGIDLLRYSSPWVGGDGVFGIGRLVRQKGFDTLVDAVRRLPGTHLTLAGEGTERAQLTAPHVTLLGAVDDIPARLARASVFAMPSRWEGFGLAALEAMAAGVPVVATAVDGLAELVGDAALVVPPDDPAALAAALHAVLTDPTLAKSLSERGRQRARQFSVNTMVSALSDLYNRVLERRVSKVVTNR